MADGESVNLVCLATMTTKTGWQFLYEKLGIETNEKLDDPNHSLDVNILELFKDLQPQLSTKMIFKIHYCKISHEFGDVLHRPDMIPDSAAGNELLLTRLKEARYMSNKYQRGTGNHEAGTPDCGQFRKCLMFLMLFADFNGILATGYRLLTTEMLMVLFDQGQVHLDFSSFPPERAAESDIRKLVEYCLYPLCLGSGSVHTRRISIIAPTTKRDLAEGVTVDNSRAIRRAIQRPMGPDFHVSKRRLVGCSQAKPDSGEERHAPRGRLRLIFNRRGRAHSYRNSISIFVLHSSAGTPKPWRNSRKTFRSFCSPFRTSCGQSPTHELVL